MSGLTKSMEPAIASPMMKRAYDWTMRSAAHEKAPHVLFWVAFAESSIFPIPPDAMLIPMILANRAKAWVYAAICTVGSVIGSNRGGLSSRRFLGRSGFGGRRFFQQRPQPPALPGPGTGSGSGAGGGGAAAASAAAAARAVFSRSSRSFTRSSAFLPGLPLLGLLPCCHWTRPLFRQEARHALAGFEHLLQPGLNRTSLREVTRFGLVLFEQQGCRCGTSMKAAIAASAVGHHPANGLRALLCGGPPGAGSCPHCLQSFV